VLLVGAGLGILAGPAQAATNIGQAEGSGSASCGGQATLVQSATDPASPSYAVPAGGGVITSWSHDHFNTNTAEPVVSVRLKVFREISEGTYFTVGHSSFEMPPFEGLSEFPTRISAQGGDVLGIHGTPFFDCFVGGNSGDEHMNTNFGGADPAVGTTFEPEFTSTGTLLNVAAVVEPDSDGDGFGDETQDGCPTDASTQGGCPPPDGDGDGLTDAQDACPTAPGPSSNGGCPIDSDAPETAITKEPPNRGEENKVKVKFIADEPNSTFDCRIDKKPWKSCTSPKKFKVKDGKHEFQVRAVDPTGNADLTPDRDKFRVTD
jgi:hypothetical protein